MLRRMLPLVLAGCLQADAAPADLEALTASLKGGTCVRQDAVAADSWFVGDLTVADGQITGTERWVLRANEAWKAHGGKDCQVDWRITGTATPPCDDCTIALKVHAEADRASSDCPSELVYGRKTEQGKVVGAEANDFDTRYDVIVKGGVATVKFASNGREVGTGKWESGHLTYVSHHQCKWF